MLKHNGLESQASKVSEQPNELAPLIAVNVPYLGSYAKSSKPPIPYGIPAPDVSRRRTSPGIMVLGMMAPPESTPRSWNRPERYTSFSQVMESLRTMLAGLFSGFGGSYDFTGGYPAIGRKYPGYGVTTSPSSRYRGAIEDSPYSPTYRGNASSASLVSPSYQEPSSAASFSPTYQAPSSASSFSPTYQAPSSASSFSPTLQSN